MVSAPGEAADAVLEAGGAFAAFVAALDSVRFHARPSPGEWSVAELAAHTAEFPLTFATAAARLTAQPGIALGRQLDDPGRLAAISRLAGAGPREAADQVRAACEQAASIIRAIPADAWEVAGTRIVNGDPITVGDVIERFVIEHLRGHLAQAREATA